MRYLEKFDGYDFELAIDPVTREATASIEEVCRLCNRLDQPMKTTFKGLEVSRVKIATVKTKAGIERFTLLPLSLVIAALIKYNPDLIAVLEECCKDNALIFPQIDYSKIPRRVSPKLIEKKIQRKLAAELGGIMEVSVRTGRIDILTETEIIEIKELKFWKAGAGQLMIYKQSYPDHACRLYLFGFSSPLIRETIINACRQLNINVEFND